MGPLKQRQYADRPPWNLCPSLRRSITFFEMLHLQNPKRVVQFNQTRPVALIASDAQAEPGVLPTGGYLLDMPATGKRTGAYLTFHQDTLDLWGYRQAKLEEGGNPIALCEGAMVPIALYTEASKLKHCDVLWFVDNTSALHSMIKGSARSEWLDRSVALFHFLAFHHDVHVWFEFVDSESNWSDGISRDLGEDKWAKQHGFALRELSIPLHLWKGPLHDVWENIMRE